MNDSPPSRTMRTAGIEQGLLTIGGVLDLQRTVGNATVAKLLGPKPRSPGQNVVQRAWVTGEYLRTRIGMAQDLVVRQGIVTIAGVEWELHTHANNTERSPTGDYRNVTHFTVTARPRGEIGHAGHHLNYQEGPRGWVSGPALGIPPAILAYMTDLGNGLAAALVKQDGECRPKVDADRKKKDRDDDRSQKRWSRMGFKTPGGSSVVH